MVTLRSPAWLLNSRHTAVQRATHQVPGAAGPGRKAPGEASRQSQAKAGEVTRTHGPPSQDCRFAQGDEAPAPSRSHRLPAAEPTPALPAPRPLPWGTLPTLCCQAVESEPSGLQLSTRNRQSGQAGDDEAGARQPWGTPCTGLASCPVVRKRREQSS